MEIAAPVFAPTVAQFKAAVMPEVSVIAVARSDVSST